MKALFQKIKKKLKLKTIIAVMPTVLLLVFLYATMLNTFVKKPVRSAIGSVTVSFSGFSSLSKKFDSVLQNNLYGKNHYISLNGLMTRVLGINSLNERQKMTNGHLSVFASASNTTRLSDSVITLNEFLNDRDIDFLYLLVPREESFYAAGFSSGYSSTSWQDIDSMFGAMTEAGVNAIDMDAYFEQNGWAMEDVFFKTDHHWLPEAAFVAAHESLLFMEENFGIEYDDSMANYDMWKIDRYEKYFLGSHGKRVGTLYAGVDDFDVIYRKGSDAILSYLPSGSTTWHYRDSLIDYSKLERVDYYNKDPYASYIGGDYPIVKIINKNALNDLKILVIGDSFRRPFESFLSSYFSCLYHIDLRHYSDGTLAEYVENIQPDIVIMCAGCPCYDNKLFSFGVEEYLSDLEVASEDRVIDLGDVSIDAKENNNNFAVLCAGLESDQVYTLTLDSITHEGGEDLYVQMTVQNLATNKAVCNRYFDVNSDEGQKWIFKTPEKDDGLYAIYLYAGTKGHTQGVSVEVTDIELRKGIFEN